MSQAKRLHGVPAPDSELEFIFFSRYSWQGPKTSVTIGAIIRCTAPPLARFARSEKVTRFARRPGFEFASQLGSLAICANLMFERNLGLQNESNVNRKTSV